MTIKKIKTNLGSAGRAPSLRVMPWHLLTTEEKARKNLMVAARTCTSQADSTVQYKKNEQYNTQKENSNTE
jgi:hypothetical protein